MEWIGILFLGFLLGMKHSTDADHVVAVTTVVSQQRKIRMAALIGVLWGVGHTLTVFLIGCAIIYLKWSISPTLGLSMEFSVGCMIVILGLWSIRHFWKKSHEHGVPTGSTERTKGFWLRPFAVGLIHGMAGSAAVALLVLSELSNQGMAFIYLLLFGLGTVAGMMLVTLAISVPYRFSSRVTRFHRWLGLSTAVFSIGFGLLLMYELGIQNGLLTGNPEWSPK